MPQISDSGAADGIAIRVDPDELDGTGASLRQLAAILARGGGSAPDTGEPYLSAAVADVEADWSKARDTLTSWFDATGTALQNAAAAYRGVDGAVAGAATPGAPATAGIPHR